MKNNGIGVSLQVNSRCHTKIWIGGALPADPSFGMAMTMILKDMFLRPYLMWLCYSNSIEPIHKSPLYWLSYTITYHNHTQRHSLFHFSQMENITALLLEWVHCALGIAIFIECLTRRYIWVIPCHLITWAQSSCAHGLLFG